MAGPLETIPETLIIPKRSRERFLSLDAGGAGAWYGNGVYLAGISDLTAGYKVVRNDCGWHALLYCASGKMRVWLEGEVRDLCAGELAWFPAKALHKYEAHTRCSMVWLHLDAGHRRWKHLGGEARRIWPAQTRDWLPLFEHVYTEMQRAAGIDHCVCRAGCESILACVEREFAQEESAATTRHRQRLQELWQTVAEDLARAWSVNDLAREAAMSTAHLHAIAQELFGATPMGMVTRLRMERARILLQHTQLTLDAIAQQVGYATGFAFSRAYKRHAGQPPSAIRK